MSLPESLGQLKKLKTLSIRSCRGLKALPESLGDLQLLQVLDLQDCCQLAVLPQSCRQLSSLHTLQVGGTRIATAEADDVGLLQSLIGLFKYGCVDCESSRSGSKLQGKQQVQLRIEQILQLQEVGFNKQQQFNCLKQRGSKQQDFVVCGVGLPHGSLLLMAAAAASGCCLYLASRAQQQRQSI